MPAKRIDGRTYEVVSIKNVESSVSLQGLNIPAHDYIGLTYTGSNLTGVTYRNGGASGAIVATLTLTYDGSNNLTSLTKN